MPANRGHQYSDLHRVAVNLSPRAYAVLDEAVKLTGAIKTDTATESA